MTMETKMDTVTESGIHVPEIPRISRKIDTIIVHCSATPEGASFNAADIDRWHRKPPFNFRCIGYHYVVLLDGTIELGRRIEEVGAHCAGHNKHSIGVCYIGGVRKDGHTAEDTRTVPQKEALVALLKALKKTFPNAKIRGHRDFANKDCPSFDATNEYLFLSDNQ